MRTEQRRSYNVWIRERKGKNKVMGTNMLKEPTAQKTSDFLEAIERVNSVYIYGYSNMSRNAYSILKSIFGEKIKGFVVSALSKKTSALKDKVFEEDHIVFGNSMIIIATNMIFWEEISEKIKGKCKYLFYYTEEMDTALLQMCGKIPMIETRFLNICVGQACNYRCKDCANFAPYAKTDHLRYPIGSIVEDIEKLFPFFSKIDTLHIQGGGAVSTYRFR